MSNHCLVRFLETECFTATNIYIFQFNTLFQKNNAKKVLPNITPPTIFQNYLTFQNWLQFFSQEISCVVHTVYPNKRRRKRRKNEKKKTFAPTQNTVNKCMNRDNVCLCLCTLFTPHNGRHSTHLATAAMDGDDDYNSTNDSELTKCYAC